VGVSEASIWQWENNHTEPKPYLIPRIIEFLGYAPWRAPVTFGEWLVMARRMNGFSRKRLAKHLQVDESTVFLWETGRKHPAPHLVAGLKAILAAGDQ
jgi:transcriptional regulator with XRE-family HTH domain